MLTKEQVEARRAWIGASDMAAILGVSPHDSAADIWLQKTDQIDSAREKPSDAARFGNYAEPFVLDEAEKQLGKIIRPTESEPLQFVLEGSHLRASLDGMIAETREPVDAKTSGIYSFLGPEWGEEETDEVPASYIVQLHAQMLCIGEGVKRAFIAAILGGRGLRIYPVERNEKICHAIKVAAEKFWQHVVDKTPPPDSVPSLEVVKAVRRVPEKIIDLTEEQQALVADWQEKSKARGEAEKLLKESQARVIAALGDAEAAHAGPLGAITYYEEHRDGYEVKAYSFRQLRLRKKGL